MGDANVKKRDATRKLERRFHFTDGKLQALLRDYAY